jgi:hypothetical protein
MKAKVLVNYLGVRLVESNKDFGLTQEASGFSPARIGHYLSNYQALLQGPVL